MFRHFINATVAQLVEQRIRNAQAVGSSPTSSSKKHLTPVKCFFNEISETANEDVKNIDRIRYCKK